MARQRRGPGRPPTKGKRRRGSTGAHLTRAPRTASGLTFSINLRPNGTYSVIPVGSRGAM